MIMDSKTKLRIHFMCGNKRVGDKVSYFAPRVGDEIRLPIDNFYKVERLVWVFDEDDNIYSRLNVAVSKIQT